MRFLIILAFCFGLNSDTCNSISTYPLVNSYGLKPPNNLGVKRIVEKKRSVDRNSLYRKYKHNSHNLRNIKSRKGQKMLKPYIINAHRRGVGGGGGWRRGEKTRDGTNLKNLKNLVIKMLSYTEIAPPPRPPQRPLCLEFQLHYFKWKKKNS